MITPQFTINQDPEFIHVKVQVSNVRFNATSLEMVVDGNVFIFHLSPYYLRLRFPHDLIDDERAKAEYDSSNECINIKVPKAEPGQEFEDLDLTSKLLARSNETETKKPLIEEIGGDEKQDIKQAEDFNWEIKQEVEAPDMLKIKYGFENNYDSIIGTSIANGNDINELDDPEHTQPVQRIHERLLKENYKFDPEYYASEYMTSKYDTAEDLEINGIQQLLEYTPSVVKQYLKWYKQNPTENMVFEFTEEEQKRMQNLPKKSYLVSDSRPLYITIVSLLFGLMFETVENEGTHTPESPWTIGKLTAQLACLDQNLLLPDTDASIIKGCIVTGIRRSLSYPLHRNYDLSIKCWNDVYYIMRGGKKLIIRCLLDIHELFRFHDIYYVYNKIILDDLLAWFIQEGSENVLKTLTLELRKELKALQKDEIEFQVLDISDGEWETLNLKEIEILTEQEYLASQEQ